MSTSDERFQAVQDAELALLTSSTRHDPAQVERLLHPDFVEIGRSGRLWAREDIVRAMAEEPHRSPRQTDEWVFAELAPDLVLVTFRVRSEAGSSRHSSIWDLSSGHPRIRFHQGTVQPEAGVDRGVSSPSGGPLDRPI